MKNQIYNVGLSTANISKLELAQTIKKYIKELQQHEISIDETEINKYHEINNFLIEELEIIKQEIKLLYTTSEEAFLAH